MSVNLFVWAWSDAYDTAAKRKRHGVRTTDVADALIATRDHDAAGPCDFRRFLAALRDTLGPEVADAPYLLERYEHAVCVNVPERAAAQLVPVVGGLARDHGLNCVQR